MPLHTPQLADRRGRGVIVSWRDDLGFGHIRSHLGETVRVNHDARQAALWPQIGEEITYSYEVCPKTGDVVAVGLRLTSPRRSPPPAPARRGFFA